MGKFLDDYNEREKARIEAENKKSNASSSIAARILLNMNLFKQEQQEKFESVFDEFVSDVSQIPNFWASTFSSPTPESLRMGVAFGRGSHPQGPMVYEEHHAFWIDFEASSNTITYDYTEFGANIFSRKETTRGLIEYEFEDQLRVKQKVSPAATAKEYLARYFANFSHPSQTVLK